MHKTKNIIMASTFFKRWKMIKTAITKDHHEATKFPKPKGLNVETKLIIKPTGEYDKATINIQFPICL